MLTDARECEGKGKGKERKRGACQPFSRLSAALPLLASVSVVGSLVSPVERFSLHETR